MRLNVRPSFAALNQRGRYGFREPSVSVDHLVVGGGVVGLAIAAKLVQMYPQRSTVVVERHSKAGQETSSRNSEVIHAGLYYSVTSLKTKCCLRGRQLLYDYCASHSVPHKRIGKLVVGEEHQIGHLKALHEHAQRLRQLELEKEGGDTSLAPETELVSGDEARELEPDLGVSIKGAVLSRLTGIVDSHVLVQSLERDIGESESGTIAYGTRVVRVDGMKEGWAVQVVSGDQSDGYGIHTPTVINASGLSAHLILNSLRDPDSRIPLYFARGSYASYNRRVGVENVSRLLYPVPDGHGFASLGTHLTLDMGGHIRFGPDLEWVDAEEDKGDRDGEWWEGLLKCELSEGRREEMHEAISRYLPGVEKEGLGEDYCGIRPKLVGPGASGFQDFVIRLDQMSDYGMSGEGAMISLLGIESPGLTSCLSLAEDVGWLVSTSSQLRK